MMPRGVSRILVCALNSLPFESKARTFELSRDVSSFSTLYQILKSVFECILICSKKYNDPYTVFVLNDTCQCLSVK